MYFGDDFLSSFQQKITSLTGRNLLYCVEKPLDELLINSSVNYLLKVFAKKLPPIFFSFALFFLI